MRELTIPEAGPKRKLLDAAEQLVAVKGFEAVAIRDVTKLAGMNIAAVNYHFGSRDEMMALVMVRYARPINEERMARLDIAEQRWPGKVVPVEEILSAFVSPLFAQIQVSSLSEESCYRLIGRIFANHGDGMLQWIEKDFDQVSKRFTQAFARSQPSLGAEDLAARIHFILGALIHLLTHQSQLVDASGVALNMEIAIARLIHFAALGMRGGAEVEVVPKEEPQAMFNF
jgi:AcrR family transcriptional regulator